MWSVPKDVAELPPDEDGTIWVVRASRGQIHRLDEIAVLVRRSAVGRSTALAVAEDLCRAHGWQVAEVAPVVESFIDELLEAGLLEQKDTGE